MEAQALTAIAHELRRIADAQSPAKQMLGFGQAPKSEIYVFCNRNNGGIWYTLDDQSKAVLIEQPALTGYIRKLEFKETIRRNEKSHKLHCYVEADRMYVLESTATVHFSKGLLSVIAFLSPEELRVPITVVPQASTQNAEVLFCNICQGNDQVFAPYDDKTDWKRVSRAAIDNVKLANGETLAMPTVA